MLARAGRLDVAGKTLRAAENPLHSTPCLQDLPGAYCSWAMGRDRHRASRWAWCRVVQSGRADDNRLTHLGRLGFAQRFGPATRDDPEWSRVERQLAQPVWTLRLAHHPDRRSASSCGTSKPLDT